MRIAYKSPKPACHFLQSKSVEARELNFMSQFSNMIHFKLQELTDSYLIQDSKKYGELSTDFCLVISELPKEVFVSSEFLDFIDFILRVLTESTNSIITNDTLLLIPPIVTKNYSTVKEFEKRDIIQILYQLTQSDDLDIIDNSIRCIASLIGGTDTLEIYEPFTKYEIKELAAQSFEIKKSVLYLCSSIIKCCPDYFEYRDQIILLGLELFDFDDTENDDENEEENCEENDYKFNDGNDIEFLDSLRLIFKKCPADVFDLFRSFNDDNEKNFLYTLSTWINPKDDNDISIYVLKLFYTMMKYMRESISDILSYLKDFQEDIIAISKKDNPSIISLSYKILSSIIPTCSSTILKLINSESDFFQIILGNIENGEFCLRKSAIRLTNTLMRYGSFYQEINEFYSIEFINVISNLLYSDSLKLNLYALKALDMIAQRAASENIDELIFAFCDQNIIETFDYLSTKYEDNEKIGLYIEKIASSIPANDEM